MSFPIVFATDENYIVPTYVAVHSLFRHLNPETDVKIFILSSGIKDEHKKYFYELSEKIQFLEVKMNNLNLNISIPYISIATYYRFLIPDLLKEYDKCLYLDSDIVVKQDITPLLKTKIDKYLLMGVRNYFSQEEDFDFYKKRCMECSIENLNHYVNAGVLLLNLEKIRKANVLQAMIDDANSCFYMYNDQDVINKHCNKKIGLLKLKYNFMAPYLKNIKATSKAINENIFDVAQDPIIVHYSTKKKPWKYKGYLMADLWEEEVEAIPQKVRKEFVSPFIYKSKITRKCKEKLLDELKFIYRKYFVKNFIETPQTKFRL